MFSVRFNGTKMKLNLKLAITRLQMLQKKNENLGHTQRKEIAKLLEKGKDEMARIRTEQIIRDDYLIETMEILEMYLTLLQTRFGLIESIKYCDPGLIESVATVIWLCPRLSHDVGELKEIRAGFAARYGKDFAEECLENRNETVNQRVIHKMSIHQPDPSLVNAYLQTIADKYHVQWKPPQVDLLSGGAPDAPSTSDFPGSFPGGFPTPPPGSGSAGGAAGGNAYTPYPEKPGFPPAASAAFPPAQSYPPQASYPTKPGSSMPPAHMSAPAYAPPEQGSYPPPRPDTNGAGPDLLAFPQIPGSASTPNPGVASAPPSNPGFPPAPASSNGGPPSFQEATAPSAELPDLPPFPPAAGVGGASVGTASTGSDVPDFDELTRRFNALKKNNR